MDVHRAYIQALITTSLYIVLSLTLRHCDLVLIRYYIAQFQSSITVRG